MNNVGKILVIDDERDILMLVKRMLEKDHHQVTIIDEVDTLSKKDYSGYDLMILDVMMPGKDGFTLCKEIRDLVDCPILFLTAKVMEEDVLYGLGIGGDDYIKKPFTMGELRARVLAHLRREQREKKNYYSVGDCSFAVKSCQLQVRESVVPLTKSQYAICEYLARHRGQVFSKERLYEAVFGYDGESDSACIAEHIKNIRRKLQEHEIDPIKTVWGVGYKWE